MSFRLLRDAAKVIQENHYYPFGQNMVGIEELDQQSLSSQEEQKFQYNAKEKLDEFGLYWNDHGARNLDLQTGRWTSVDPLAEKFSHQSPYCGMDNNPVNLSDPTGKSAVDFYNTQGDKIGTDGNNEDKRKFVVTNKKEAKQIEKTSGNITLTDIQSGVLLPSNAVLEESLNVLKRTEQNGGLREEKSFVLKDGRVFRAPTGELPKIVGNVQTADAPIVPLPQDVTSKDIEASIHSHLTEIQRVGDMIYPQEATKPSMPADKIDFSQFNTNIIVGPLGAVNLNNVTAKSDGTFNIPSRPNGIAIYDANSTLKIALRKSSVEKILK